MSPNPVTLSYNIMLRHNLIYNFNHKYNGDTVDLRTIITKLYVLLILDYISIVILYNENCSKQ